MKPNKFCNVGEAYPNKPLLKVFDLSTIFTAWCCKVGMSIPKSFVVSLSFAILWLEVKHFRRESGEVGLQSTDWIDSTHHAYYAIPGDSLGAWFSFGADFPWIRTAPAPAAPAAAAWWMGGWMATEFFSGQQSEGKKLVPQHLKMDGWNTTFWGGIPILRGELLVSGKVTFDAWTWCLSFWKSANNDCPNWHQVTWCSNKF